MYMYPEERSADAKSLSLSFAVLVADAVVPSGQLEQEVQSLRASHVRSSIIIRSFFAGARIVYNNVDMRNILTVDLKTLLFGDADLLDLEPALNFVEDRSAEQQVDEEEHQQHKPLLLRHSPLYPLVCVCKCM